MAVVVESLVAGVVNGAVGTVGIVLVQNKANLHGHTQPCWPCVHTHPPMRQSKKAYCKTRRARA